MSINWLGIPLEEFSSALERQEDGTYVHRRYPHGEGASQVLVMRLRAGIEDGYEKFMGPDEWERYETSGEVPVIRNGRREYEPLKGLTLGDLPTILDTLQVLEEEEEQRQREESERKAAERKRRERIRAKERSQLKKLGEW